MTAPRYVWLHGFASGPASLKAGVFAERLAKSGLSLERPDLNRPSFAALTCTAALAELDRLHAERPDAPWRLVGSSMGGYLAARWAGLHPERVERLVLLCPGFGLADRWPQLLGPRAFEAWRQRGHHPFVGADGATVDVHWGLVADAMDHPAAPDVDCPTLVIHGVHDAVVPVEGSRAWADGKDDVTLLELADDHGLAASAGLIARLCEDFLVRGVLP